MRPIPWPAGGLHPWSEVYSAGGRTKKTQVDSGSAERLAKNEAFFRQVNERINEVAARAEGDHSYDFLCECADPGCTERITMTRDQYEEVRQSSTRFVLALGHVAPEIEHVVERQGDHVVIEKKGIAARVAAMLDPRTA